MKAKQRANDHLPFVLQDAFEDPENCSMDPGARLALSDDPGNYTWALILLRNMYEFGRQEAGVFLLGLLMTCRDNWEKRVAIVHILRYVRTEDCVRMLFDELKRTKNTNSTRRYLNTVIDVLSNMPPQLVRSGFEALAQDKSFTNRMRENFRRVLNLLDYEVTRGQRRPATEKSH